MVLARHLPMAVLYDPHILDLSDAAVADRLRKQAKTRAVKVAMPPYIGLDLQLQTSCGSCAYLAVCAQERNELA